MAGRKRLEIVESSEELRIALIRNKGKSVEQILRILLFLKEHPSFSIKKIAGEFQLSERTLYRWLRSYRQYGLEGVLNDSLNLADDTRGSKAGETEEVEETAPLISKRTIALLNQLPLTTETVEWCREIKHLLCNFFDDVDQVVVNIRTTLDLINPSSNRPGQVHRQSLFTHKKLRRETSVLHDVKGKTKWEQIYEEGIRNDFPAEMYREPIGFDYYYQTDESYIGTIILFSRRERQPISGETLMTMEELRPFFLYILSDHIARHRMAHPEDILFRDLLNRISVDTRLSQREGEILMLLVLGYSYDKIAAHLFISVKTVESHIQAIYRKVGVQNLKEIFARYLSPRIFFQE